MRYNRIYIKLVVALLGCSLLAGCDKYLDVKPKGYTLLTTVKDYDQWMNGSTLWMQSFELNYFSDMIDHPNTPIPAITPNDLMYLWTPQYTTAAGVWGIHYSNINANNTVINGVENATGGTERQKSNLKAEALLARAYEYLYLVNEYGRSYDSAAAATDLGVPFVTSDDVAQVVPARSSVKEIYDHIIEDINAAIPNLPEDNSANRYRGTVAAAYSVLARVYLNAHAYNQAKEYASLALQHSGRSMIDYNQLTTGLTLPALDRRPDAIYARTAGGEVYYPSNIFLRTFNRYDARLRLFYTPLGDYTFPTRQAVRYFPGGQAPVSGQPNVYANWGTTVQEMKLIIAEAAARANDVTEALKQLDEVRKNRIPAANYQPYTSNDAAFVLEKVLEERRFEFPFTGLRWLDMRRLDAEGRTGPFYRLNAQGDVIATLEPHSIRYVLQVPAMVIQYNPAIQQNP